MICCNTHYSYWSINKWWNLVFVSLAKNKCKFFYLYTCTCSLQLTLPSGLPQNGTCKLICKYWLPKENWINSEVSCWRDLAVIKTGNTDDSNECLASIPGILQLFNTSYECLQSYLPLSYSSYLPGVTVNLDVHHKCGDFAHAGLCCMYVWEKEFSDSKGWNFRVQ